MKILIKNLEFETIIGMLEFERENTQKIRLSLSIKADGFICYAKICKNIEKIYNKHKFKKVESSLIKTTKILKKKFPQITQIKIEILKLNIISNALVGAKFKKKY